MEYKTVVNARKAANELEEKGAVAIWLTSNELNIAEIFLELKTLPDSLSSHSLLEGLIYYAYFFIWKSWRVIGASSRYPKLKELWYFCELSGCYNYRLSNRSENGAEIMFYRRASDFYRAKSC